MNHSSSEDGSTLRKKLRVWKFNIPEIGDIVKFDSIYWRNYYVFILGDNILVLFVFISIIFLTTIVVINTLS